MLGNTFLKASSIPLPELIRKGDQNETGKSSGLKPTMWNNIDRHAHL